VKTTVIIPVYNRPDKLALAVRSLIPHLADADLDILIVDDGSTDETRSVISDLVDSIPEVRTVRRKNGGVTKARNTGLDNLLPNTEIVTFLDSDDAMAPERFRADLPVLAARPEVEITYGNMIATRELDPETLAPSCGAPWKELTSIHLSCALLRRSLVDRIGRFDETLVQAEDTDYLLRIFESGTQFVQTGTICHYYLRHAGGMTRDFAAGRKYFALAVMKSLQRRRANPLLELNKPAFDINLPRELI
jgi:glycosyltransferase involved in cell wall biosynthesis